MRKITVYIVGNATNYADFLTCEFERVKIMHNADVVIFTGGEDVNPAYYGEDANPRTMISSRRDEAEIKEFQRAVALKKLIIGICRGAQFCTVMSGGKLIQHVNGHGLAGGHNITIIGENREMAITSTHHQMMYPFLMDKNDFKIIARSSRNLSDVYYGSTDKNRKMPKEFVEPEIVYYPKSNALAIQGHPEYMPKESQAVEFINLLVEELLDGKEPPIQYDDEDDAPMPLNNRGQARPIQAINPDRGVNVERAMRDIELRAQLARAQQLNAMRRGERRPEPIAAGNADDFFVWHELANQGRGIMNQVQQNQAAQQIDVQGFEVRLDDDWANALDNVRELNNAV